MTSALAVDRYQRVLDRVGSALDAPDTRPLWVGRQGAMTTSGITDALHRMCRDAGVPQLHPHQFRHTLAARWLEAGHGEGDLMEIAGWRSRTMLDRYGAYTRNERAQHAHRRASLGTRV